MADAGCKPLARRQPPSAVLALVAAVLSIELALPVTIAAMLQDRRPTTPDRSAHLGMRQCAGFPPACQPERDSGIEAGPDVIADLFMQTDGWIVQDRWSGRTDPGTQNGARLR